MIQNIGAFLVLSWLWATRTKQPEVVVTEREPFVPAVTPIPLNFTLDEGEDELPLEPEPSNGLPVCPPLEVRMDLTTVDTLPYDPRITPCGCPSGYRKVEVRRGKYQTATRCYNGP